MAGTLERKASSSLASDPNGDEEHFHLHSAVTDAALQSGLVAYVWKIDASNCRAMPTMLEKVTIFRCAPDAAMKRVRSKVRTIFLSRRVWIWRPHIDFLDAASLIKPEIPRQEWTPPLDEMALCSLGRPSSPGFSKSSPMHSMMTQSSSTRCSVGTSACLAHQSPAALMVWPRWLRIDALLSGQKDHLELLQVNGTLATVYASINAAHRAAFIRNVAHTGSNLRTLKLGAGTGASTASILRELVLPIGKPLYSKYTFADNSDAAIVNAKKLFKDYQNMEYRVLDISNDKAEQGFEKDKYDLVVAANVIHATDSLKESLANVHKLLALNGRLLLQELHTPSKWVNYIRGLTDGWWHGEADGRVDKPYAAPARWESGPKDAGFTRLDAALFDFEEPHQLNAIMVAKPDTASLKPVNKAVTLLCENGTKSADALTQQLQCRGYTVERRRLGDELLRLAARFLEGRITPLAPRNAFDASAAEDATKNMQRGQHVGKEFESMGCEI
ncbi:hypothetical protein DL765_009148 [Monosporascus sp. GIB2]|nr:hypothetical protein DL765_009148 [Monosporascus sp. GIB2]